MFLLQFSQRTVPSFKSNRGQSCFERNIAQQTTFSILFVNTHILLVSKLHIFANFWGEYFGKTKDCDIAEES